MNGKFYVPICGIFPARDGDEGRFPELEAHCKNRLIKLCPESRALRESLPVLNRNNLPPEEQEELTTDLAGWISELNELEKHSKAVTIDFNDLPPVRSTQPLMLNKDRPSDTGTKNKRALPRSYQEWDAIERQIDSILADEKGDASEEKGAQIAVSESERKSLLKSEVSQMKTRSEKLPLNERISLAEREKEKGNEAFHAGDFNEAERDAAKEATKSLELEPTNEKALFRRGKAYFELQKLVDAEKDLEILTDLDLSNTKAQELLRQIRDSQKKRQESRLEGGRRLQVEEVGDSDSDDSEESDKVVEVVEIKPVKKSPLEEYEELKELGNKSHQEEEHEKAMEMYTKSYHLAKDKHLGKALQALALRNRALSLICMEDYNNAFSDCNKALQLEPNCPKTLYRRALARKSMNDLPGALTDLEQALKLKPDNVMIKKLIDQVIEKIESSKRVEEQQCGGPGVLVTSVGSPEFETLRVASSCSGSDNEWELIKNERKTSLFPQTGPITSFQFDAIWSNIAARFGSNERGETIVADIVELIRRIRPERLPEVLGMKAEPTLLEAISMAISWLLKSEKKEDTLLVKDTLVNLCRVARIDLAIMMISHESSSIINESVADLDRRKLINKEELELLNAKLVT
ncbi:Sperm associated antigen 1 [Cichlidogyrus casuarinus]|uniref:Sperm associated antigen 1 n=1 Tax=Cichlidogyrus casuarinus TaxID=1844966 RepID=A0ABD2PWZ4_9PLAT